MGRDSILDGRLAIQRFARMVTGLCRQVLRQIAVLFEHNSELPVIAHSAACTGIVSVAIGADWRRDEDVVGTGGQCLRRRSGEQIVLLNMKISGPDHAMSWSIPAVLKTKMGMARPLILVARCIKQSPRVPSFEKEEKRSA